MSMSKPELIKIVADSAAITLKAAEQAVNTLTREIVEQVWANGRFALDGIGVFTRVDRAARTGRDPRNGSPIHIPEKKAVKFKPSVSFKAALNE